MELNIRKILHILDIFNEGLTEIPIFKKIQIWNISLQWLAEDQLLHSPIKRKVTQ